LYNEKFLKLFLKIACKVKLYVLVYVQQSNARARRAKENMKITRKEEKFTEAMLNDMYAEKLLQKYYEKKYGDNPNLYEEFLSLAVWVDKDTGVEHIYDIGRFENYEECKEDDNVNRLTFTNRRNCYVLFITGKRVEFLEDKPIYVVIESEAIER